MFIIIINRILLGSSNVKCPTPKAETRLRCGEVALIPLQLICNVPVITNNDDNNNSIVVNLTIIFPKAGYPDDLPLEIMLSTNNKIYNDYNNDKILNPLREFCKQKNDNDDNYPR